MKVTIIPPKPVTLPPPMVQIELDIHEARELLTWWQRSHTPGSPPAVRALFRSLASGVIDMEVQYSNLGGDA